MIYTEGRVTHQGLLRAPTAYRYYMCQLITVLYKFSIIHNIKRVFTEALPGTFSPSFLALLSSLRKSIKKLNYHSGFQAPPCDIPLCDVMKTVYHNPII